MIMKKTIAISVLTLAFLPLGGCLVSGSGSSRVSGTPVEAVTLETLHELAMTPTQVTELLGPPTRRTTLENGEIYAYEWERHHKGRASVFLLLATSNDRTEKSVAYVQFEDGVVTRTWVAR
jgi:hypothetical protein